MIEIKEDKNQSGEGMPVIQLGLIDCLAFSLDQITRTSCDKRIFGCIKVLIYSILLMLKVEKGHNPQVQNNCYNIKI